MPNIAEDYVHRIGRTGRAGSEGIAVSFVCDEEVDNLNKIEQLIQKHIPRTIDEEYKPSQALPKSRDIRPPKAKKPKKNKSLQNSEGSDSSANKNAKPNGGNRRGQGGNVNRTGANPGRSGGAAKPGRRRSGANSDNRSAGSNRNSSSGNRANQTR